MGTRATQITSDPETDAARERLLDQVLGATTLREIAHARQALAAWLEQHPGEIGMADGFEQLANMEEIAASSTSSTASESPGSKTGQKQK